MNTSCSRSQMEQSNCLEAIRFSEHPPRLGIYPARGEEHKDDLRGESDWSQPLDTITDDRGHHRDFWPIEGNYIYRHHVEPKVKLCVPEEESFPNTTAIH